MFKKLRVLVLTYDSHVPPTTASRARLKTADWKMEYEVVTALRKMGQEVKVVGVGTDLTPIATEVHEFRPHVVFNLIEEFHNLGIFDQNVVSYLELLQVPYTGCNPRGLILARDKALTKKLLAYHDIKVPEFAVFPIDRSVVKPKGLKFPLFVKTLTEEASLGISQSSLVFDDEKLEERVKFIHHQFGVDAIAESFIAGRELYVSVLGNTRVETLPIWELDFGKAAKEKAKIATRRVKWDHKYIERMGIRLVAARDLSCEVEDKIRQMCKQAYRILGLSGYARMDLRLTPEGVPYLIEANPNPHIGTDEAFASSARKAGLTYYELIWKFLQLGMNWQPGQLQVA